MGIVLAVSLFIAVNTTINSLTVNLIEGYTAYLGKYDIVKNIMQSYKFQTLLYLFEV